VAARIAPCALQVMLPVVLCLCVGAARPASAQNDRLKVLSVEELMELDVTSVSRRAEPFRDSAAAVDVITGDELRRTGVTTLPEALRLIAGVMVARSDGHTWAISARGFLLPSANKLLVLIDGRTVYSPLFAGTFWDVQDTALADIERIEVIRGPGATLWGANAVNGVINVITRSAAATIGGRLVVSAGTEDTAVITARYGDELRKGLDYRTYAKYTYFDENELASGAPARDPLRRAQVGGRIDWAISPDSALTVQGDAYNGRAGAFDRPDTRINGWNLLGRWRTRAARQSELQVQWYVDHAFRSIPFLFEESRTTVDVDLQYRLRTMDRHTVLIGGGYQASTDSTSVPGQPSAAPRNNLIAVFVPSDRTTMLVSAFAQDEIALTPDSVFLTLGARLEHNAYTGVELQPTARVRWKLQPRMTLWGAVSRAVRTPTRLDRDVRFLTTAGSALVIGGPAFESETLVATELGYRVQPSSRVSLDVSTFHNSYDHLRSQEAGVPIVLGNGLRGTTAGVELEMRVRPTEWLRFDADWTLFGKDLERRPGSTDITGGAAEGNDPRHSFGLRATMNLPGRIEIDGLLRAIDSLPSPPVPGYAELDLRAGWRVTSDWELAIVGRNLLHASHPEYGPDTPFRVEFERGVSARATVIF
jgi:iron complex outermembrane receptor protein